MNKGNILDYRCNSDFTGASKYKNYNTTGPCFKTMV